MASPTQLAQTRVRIITTALRRKYILHQIEVTADTVVLHDTNSRRVEFDHLRLHPQSKNCCMPKSIHGLEGVLSNNIIMGDMAIIAHSDSSVTTALPRGVFRRHDVAIDAGFRAV